MLCSTKDIGMVLSNRPQLISFILLMFTCFTIVIISERGEPVVVKTNLEGIPLQIGRYHGSVEHFTDTVYEELNADLSLYRHYRSEDNDLIMIYIGYYGTAKE